MSMWRYLPFELHSGAENMATDEAMLLTLAKHPASPPILRFYGWNPPTLSLGYAQRFAKEVEVTACRENGIEIVRRPTGGRAILHQYELTYSVVAPEEDEHVLGTIMESYLKISKALLHGFRDLGIAAEMAEGALDSAASAACFDAPSWYELVVGGRKLVGSAQVRKDGVLLQHGSIILHFDTELLFKVLKFSSEEVRAQQRQAFQAKACALDEVAPRPITRAELERSLCQGFEAVMGIELARSELSPEEKTLAAELQLKYQAEEWTGKR